MTVLSIVCGWGFWTTGGVRKRDMRDNILQPLMEVTDVTT